MSREGQRLITAARFDRWERRIATAVAEALGRQKAYALAAVRGEGVQAAGNPPDPFDEASWDTAVDEVVQPVAKGIMDEVADIALRLLDGLDLPAPAVDLAPHVASLVTKVRGIGADVAADLTASLTEGSILGEGLAALEARVLGIFDATEARAHTIARTSVVPAANGAHDEVAGIINDEVVALDKEWLTAQDDRVRDWHAEADGQRVPYGEPFDVGGEALQYPGDPAGSAENVINCRCVVLYPEADQAGTEAEE